MAMEITIKISLIAEGSSTRAGEIQPGEAAIGAGDVPAPPPYPELATMQEGNIPPPLSWEASSGMLSRDILPPPMPSGESLTLQDYNVPRPPSEKLSLGAFADEIPPPPAIE